MRILNIGRGNGKTELLIKLAHKNHYPIIVYTNEQKTNIENRLKYKQWSDVKIYTLRQWLALDMITRQQTPVYVDEYEFFMKDALQYYLGSEVDITTGTLYNSMLQWDENKCTVLSKMDDFIVTSGEFDLT